MAIKIAKKKKREHRTLTPYKQRRLDLGRAECGIEFASLPSVRLSDTHRHGKVLLQAWACTPLETKEKHGLVNFYHNKHFIIDHTNVDRVLRVLQGTVPHLQKSLAAIYQYAQDNPSYRDSTLGLVPVLEANMASVPHAIAIVEGCQKLIKVNENITLQLDARVDSLLEKNALPYTQASEGEE